MLGAGELLLSQKHIKERKKRRQWVHPWIRKRDSKGYFSIINDLRLTDKADFKNSIQIKIKIMCFHFLYTVQVGTVYQNVLYNSCLFLFLRHGVQKIKEHILHKWGFIVFCSKNNFCVMNKIKLVWFYSLHILFFWVKMWPFYIF